MVGEGVQVPLLAVLASRPLSFQGEPESRYAATPSDTFVIPEDIVPEKLEIGTGEALTIVWKHDGGRSVLPARFLWEIGQSGGRLAAPGRRLWDRDSMRGNFPTMNHEEILSSDQGLLRWLSMVEDYGFALAAGVPPTLEATQGTRDAGRLCARDDIRRDVGFHRQLGVQGHGVHVGGHRAPYRRDLQFRFARLPDVSLPAIRRQRRREHVGRRLQGGGSNSKPRIRPRSKSCRA